MNDRLSARTHLAQSDVWQAEGRLRARLGGGAAELPGVRLMASGLPHAQWNNGDVTDPTLVSVADVRDWFAGRANGAGVPWGLRVPADVPFPHGRRLFRQPCMALRPADHRLSAPSPAAQIETASQADLDDITRIDAAAYGGTADGIRPWIEPQLDAAGFSIALARLGGEAVGIATAKFTDDRAGPCVGIYGVAVAERARRRGIAAALTAWLLERAWADGATLAHLNPVSEAVARLYARMGFVETAGLDIYVDA